LVHETSNKYHLLNRSLCFLVHDLLLFELKEQVPKKLWPLHSCQP
jgi:hypothetical protein